VISSVATIILLAIVVGAASIAALQKLTLPLVLAGLAAVGYAAVFAIRATRIQPDEQFERGRAFNLRVAVALAVTVTIVMLASSVLTSAFGRAGLVLGTATAGLADSQSAAISAATLSSSGQISTDGAAVAILAALTSNTFSKAAVAAVLGNRRYAANVWPGLALILAAAWGGWAVADIG
jgi:uncharacterized membrane protein (DUF4010 family)